jgi:hypothetical protein
MGNKLPIIYGDIMPTSLDFLNEFEKNYLFGANKELQETIITRGKIFFDMHKEWTNWDDKNKVLHKVDKWTWEKKTRTMLQLKYHFRYEQINLLLGQYFGKVELPKGEDLKIFMGGKKQNEKV